MYKKQNIGSKLMAWFLILLLLACVSIPFTACTLLKTTKGAIEESFDTETTNTLQKKSAIQSFDKTKSVQETGEFFYEPVDPSKAMEIRDNGNTLFNARKKFTQTTKKVATDQGSTKQDIEQETTDSATSQKKEASWTSKFKISVPWYVYFFGFLLLVAGFFIFKLFKNISSLSKHISDLKNM